MDKRLLPILRALATHDPGDGLSTPQVNMRLIDDGAEGRPLSGLGHDLDQLTADGLVDRYRSRRPSGARRPRHYRISAAGLARIGAPEQVTRG